MHVGYYHSPIGILEIKASKKGVSSIKKVEEKQWEEDEAFPLLRKAKKQLQEYFDKNRKNFDLELDFGGKPAFHIQVWEELLKIPYGKTTAYSNIANKLKNPDAVRAVGLANKHNPIAIVVPCHRVIGKSGHLTGYFYGLTVKRQLLALENPLSFSEQGSLF